TPTPFPYTTLFRSRIPFPTRLLLIILTALFILPGCEKEKNIISSNLKNDGATEKFKVVDGELHFINPETYIQDLKSIIAMNEEELDQWEASLGFKSYRSWFNQSADEFFNLKSENEYEAWLEAYDDILFVKDSMVNPILSHGIYEKIANRSGEFVVGQTFYKILPNCLISIPNGDRNLLVEAMKYKSSNLKKGIKIFPIKLDKEIIELRYAQTCGRLEITSSHEEGGDRKVYLTVNLGILITSVPYIGDIYETFARVDAHGRKKGLFGGWNKYKTKIYVENVSAQVKDNLG